MIIKYYLKENLLQRNAANLSFNLNEISDSIYIYRNNDERKVNGKSLIGILSGHFLQTDIINIEFNNVENQGRIQEIFNEFGEKE